MTTWKLIVGIFLILHGGVHLLYAGQSKEMFELQPGMTWPVGSWAFSRILGSGATRTATSVSLLLAALVFLAAGISLLAGQPAWRPIATVAAVFSTLVYLLMWNGKFQALDNQGFVGILINIAILVAVLVFKWPPLG